jgi:A/G-specific adenine glycosylase
MTRVPDSVTKAEITRLRLVIIRAARKVARDFPWRAANVSQFQYLVTEVLLQQTRAESVAELWNAFFARFDSWDRILETPRDELRDAIRPLGLYRQREDQLRVLAGIASASSLAAHFADLLLLPGVGPYIASAVAVRFAHEDEAMLDTNMARVLQRYFDIKICVDFRRDRALRTLARKVIAGDNRLHLNLTILDIGALFCTSRNPKHEQCPLRGSCQTFLALSRITTVPKGSIPDKREYVRKARPARPK